MTPLSSHYTVDSLERMRNVAVNPVDYFTFRKVVSYLMATITILFFMMFPLCMMSMVPALLYLVIFFSCCTLLCSAAFFISVIHASRKSVFIA
ncbi:hypothetical protein CP10139811_0309 [Chlamydia ibidis]|uniref:Uncharacterized protein n=2 Tax=Chlamydia ibidis TaxID=1405396 RepID=S7J1S5_9CHLA|nr:hypothetical protein [Chlamydia ibidis]EPP34349.1 hypothetical protein CP10139811_0309 [Chlamydia ibidis]EQM62816.1 hypothetical protein H359_0445 [Chlamydia ibidis 10-1398/6]